MGRKKKHAEEHVNLERWLVSYADFITLLFATFVVLYALSQLDLAKFKDFKISLQKAFSSAPTVLKGNEGVLNSKSSSMVDSGGYTDNMNLIPPILAESYYKKEEEDFQSALTEIDKEKLGKSNGTKVEVNERGLVIKLLGNVTFESASAVLKKESYPAVEEAARIIKLKFPNHLIRIEGHTDNQPIKSSIYPSNWELSSARASALVRYINTKFNIPSNRFSAVGYADSRPLESNDTPEGREQNRRVEIVVLRNKLIKTEILAKEFKKDLQEEIEKFKNVSEAQKKKEKEPEQSEAVKKLLEGTDAQSAEIIKLDRDSYQEEAQKILKDLKEQERAAEEEAIRRKQQFFKGASDKLKHSR